VLERNRKRAAAEFENVRQRSLRGQHVGLQLGEAATAQLRKFAEKYLDKST